MYLRASFFPVEHIVSQGSGIGLSELAEDDIAGLCKDLKVFEVEQLLLLYMAEDACKILRTFELSLRWIKKVNVSKHAMRRDECACNFLIINALSIKFPWQCSE